MRLRRAVLVALLALLVAPSSVGAAGRWRPRPGVTWQWQLQGNVDTSVRAHVYEIDMFDSPRRLVRRLHAKGRRVICYVSAGSWERWRPDADRFPERVLGKPLEGWPGERWLDISRLAVLRPILKDRMDMCARKGFDAIEFDNVDGFANDSGFPLTGSDQLEFNRWLAKTAHARGLSVGLKNDLAQVRALEPVFDFAVNEQCFQYSECRVLRRFVEHGKAVLHVEYELARSEFCPRARALGFSSMRKRYSLRAWRRPC